MATHVTSKSICPACGYVAERASNLDNDQGNPKPGDLSICFKCGALMVFQEGGTKRPASEADLLGCSFSQLKLISAQQKKIFAMKHGKG